VHKLIAVASLTLLSVVGAFIADLAVNFGLPFGYYGELNRLTAALDSLAGLEIEDVGYNSDVSLEEITFWILDARGLRHQIDFGQNDPIRKLAGNSLQSALAQRLAGEGVNF